MTRQELENTYIVNEHGTFAPRFELSITKQEIDGEVVIIEDYTITATSEEVYQEYLTPPKLPGDKMEVLKARVDGIENINAGLLFENAEHQIKIKEQEKMNKEQEVTNANLLLEIAMLKQDGGGTNVV